MTPAEIKAQIKSDPSFALSLAVDNNQLAIYNKFKEMGIPVLNDSEFIYKALAEMYNAGEMATLIEVLNVPLLENVFTPEVEAAVKEITLEGQNTQKTFGTGATEKEGNLTQEECVNNGYVYTGGKCYDSAPTNTTPGAFSGSGKGWDTLSNFFNAVGSIFGKAPVVQQPQAANYTPLIIGFIVFLVVVLTIWWALSGNKKGASASK